MRSKEVNQNVGTDEKMITIIVHTHAALEALDGADPGRADLDAARAAVARIQQIAKDCNQARSVAHGAREPYLTCGECGVWELAFNSGWESAYQAGMEAYRDALNRKKAS